VVGVDISEQRMQLCKNIIKKYHIEKATCGASTGANVNVNVITGADSGNSNDHIPLVDNDKTKSTVEVKSSIDTIEIKNKLNMNMIMNTKPRIRLYCTDGTTFGMQKIDPSSLFFDSDIALEEEEQKGKRKRMNKSARARQKKKLRKLAIDEEEKRQNEQEQQAQQMQQQCSLSKPTSVAATTSLEYDKQVALTVSLFDRVLVDAECSTDGAVRHLQHKHKKCNQALVGGAVISTGGSDAGVSDSGDNGPQKEDTDTKFEYTHNSKLTDINKLAELVDLQKRLLQSGFRLLKPGGVLVYSTCSLATEQNEKVVSWLLNLYNKEAFIIPVSFQKDSSPTTKKSEESGISSDSNSMMIYEGSLEGTVRFHPNVIVNEEKIDGSGIDHNLFGGGFFLAKIGKKLD
jgi:16S rRNA C967 or C1407 C5-methylase (RsmB/RsmF family)